MGKQPLCPSICFSECSVGPGLEDALACAGNLDRGFSACRDMGMSSTIVVPSLVVFPCAQEFNFLFKICWCEVEHKSSLVRADDVLVEDYVTTMY